MNYEFLPNKKSVILYIQHLWICIEYIQALSIKDESAL